ncbi:MAG: deoxyguanosinetriphosphate triphosphohydrolase family protein [Clostridia bacterium]
MNNSNSLHTMADTINMKYMSQLKMDCIANRIYTEETRDRVEGSFQRDFTRIMYSSSFRRLQGKMQLLGIQNDQFFRNRLTHSLEVAQIARSIANELRYTSNEIFVVEAGSLAHDIGNPPFGHAGESELDKIFCKVGGFEGNAQALRILTSLEKKKPDFRGLNLTYRTLLSIVKYFNKKQGNNKTNKKFIYDEDYDLLKSFISENHITIRTLDVQIVDLADEIAYAAHDLEDGLRVKAFIIDEILHDYHSKYGDTESYQKLKELVELARKEAGYGQKNINSAEYSKMFRQELSSSIIFTLISDIDLIDISEEFKIKTGTQNTQELGFKNYSEMAEGLKEITFKCINHNNDVYYYEQRGKVLLRYLNDLYTENTMFLPPEYRAKEVIAQYNMDCDEANLQKRLICDYISGMMDSYTISTYEKISGKSFDNILGDVKYIDERNDFDFNKEKGRV